MQKIAVNTRQKPFLAFLKHRRWWVQNAGGHVASPMVTEAGVAMITEAGIAMYTEGV
jgi:hypothetical protein